MSAQDTQIDLLVVGGGAAGFFAALAAAEARPDLRIRMLEKGTQCLAKVRISGGGRCNVTHACFEPRALAARYPRGGRALLGAFTRFQPRDTIAWFARHGVELKTEADGRMFPVTDRSDTIIECLEREAVRLGVEVRLRCGVEAVRKASQGFEIALQNGETMRASKVLFATGGCKPGPLTRLLEALGHTLKEPVPSLFTFHIERNWVRALAGLAVAQADVSVPECGLKESGPVLFTHWGLSGPAILRLSAWGARDLHQRDYRFGLRLRWTQVDAAGIEATFARMRLDQPGKSVGNTPLFGLPARLWEALLSLAQIPMETRWNQFPKAAARSLSESLANTLLPVTGKSMNKEEFVTCGGVDLKEVDFKTMESRVCPGVYFAGEVLDVDGITGGFNFQAAWTTGWLAGHAMADREPVRSGLSPS